MQETIHMHLHSTDSKKHYPDNKGTDFRVRLDETVSLTDRWCVVLLGVYVESMLADVPDALELYICSDIVGFSFVGGHKIQLLRKVNIGKGIDSDKRKIFSVSTYENMFFCKPVIVREISSIHINIQSRGGKHIFLLDKCEVTVSLHFRKIS